MNWTVSTAPSAELTQRVIAQAAALAPYPEAVLNFLSDEGLSKARAAIAYSRAMEAPLSEAKRVVHFSSAWSNRRDSDEEFQQAFLELHRSVEMA